MAQEQMEQGGTLNPSEAVETELGKLEAEVDSVDLDSVQDIDLKMRFWAGSTRWSVPLFQHRTQPQQQ